MKRPWQAWMLFFVCSLLVTAGMGWLTLKVIELEQQERVITLRADFEGDVRLALRRMDLELAELLAQESAWPYFAYRAFYLPEQPASPAVPATPPVAAVPGGKDLVKGGAADGKPPAAMTLPEPVASPLLMPDNDLVRLYFQVDARNEWISPNVPSSEENDLALSNGASPALLDQYKDRLAEFRALSGKNGLPDLVPELQPIVTPLAQNEAHSTNQPVAPEQVAANSEMQQDIQELNSPAQQAAQPTMQQTEQQPTAQQVEPMQQSYAQRFSPQGQSQRGNVEFQNRKRQFDKIVSNWNTSIQQRDQFLVNALNDQQQKALLSGDAPWAATPTVLEGRSRTMWVDSELVLARRLRIDGQDLIQGCWLDWSAIKRRLADQVADLLPALEIAPVYTEAEADPTRMLATLPAQLIVPSPTVDDAIGDGHLSPIKISLIAAWSCVALAAGAVALLLAGVISLSERRASFVSAVTHELRTPLTTFRMYSEMLAEDMVPDKSRRQQYLATLKAEADRLFHLVENVLSYARLERGRRGGQTTTIDVAQLVRGMDHRLSDRAQQAGMELVIDVDATAAERSVRTDVAAVEQVVANLVDNACKYAKDGNDSRIHLDATVVDQFILLRVRDHGPGIPSQDVNRLFRPFTKSARDAAHSAPGVGLGLALCRRIATQLGGKFYLETPAAEDGASFVLKLPARPA